MIEETTKIIQPRSHKAKICIWADLTVNNVDILSETTNADQLKCILAGMFHLDDYAENLKSAITLDLYFYTIQFAQDNKFNKEQTSTFFSIVKKTHEICIETPFDNLAHCFSYFKELVLCHAVKRPPHSIDLFTPNEVRKISEYVINTYFRHYKMYKYVFTPLVRLDLSIKYAGMPETPAPSEADANEAAETENLEAAEGDEQQTEQPTEGGDQQTEQPEKEESPAAKELKDLIKSHLEVEIKKLRVSMDEQIKESEVIINKKLTEVEASGGVAGKGGRGSGKGKKK